MKTIRSILILLLMILPLMVSCADLGAGGFEEDYMDYFSSVILMSPDGKKTKRMTDFYEAISLEDSDTMYDVVDFDDYRLIAFEVATGYTLTVSECAFFLHTEEKSADLMFSFYVADELPSRVEGNTVTTPPEEPTNPDDTTSERTEDDIFGSLDSYHNDTVSIGAEWDSTHLEFDDAQTVEAGQYIVIRITNNVCSCGEEETEPAVPFTLNYFLFYIEEVTKN